MENSQLCCICLKNNCYVYLETLSNCDVNGVKYINKIKQICSSNDGVWNEKFYVCNACIEKLNNAYDFIQTCNISEEYRKETLQKIQVVDIDNKQYICVCDICGKHFKLKRTLRMHITRVHVKPKKVEIEFNSKSEDVQDKPEQSNSEELRIKDIKQDIDDNIDFKKEYNIIQDNLDVDNNYSSSEDDESHRKRGKKKKITKKRKPPMKCDYCDVEFSRMDKYVQHVRAKHTFKKPFKCDLCEAAYYSSHNLSIHKRKHRNEKPYVCTTCGKLFVSSNDLWQHSKIHNDVREYGCNECGRCYKTHSNLRTHKLQMHLDPSLWKFVCTVCGKKFPLNNNLIKHMKRHDGIKNFSCYLCDKRFVEKIDMQTHLLSHSNERLHKCHLCTKEYKKKETLRRHLKIEHDIGNIKIKKPEKKLLCPMCPKVFAFNNKLQRHLLTHTGERPIKCDYCDKRFRDNYDRNMHYKKEHNIDMSEKNML